MNTHQFWLVAVLIVLTISTQAFGITPTGCHLYREESTKHFATINDAATITLIYKSDNFTLALSNINPFQKNGIAICYKAILNETIQGDCPDGYLELVLPLYFGVHEYTWHDNGHVLQNGNSIAVGLPLKRSFNETHIMIMDVPAMTKVDLKLISQICIKNHHLNNAVKVSKSRLSSIFRFVLYFLLALLYIPPIISNITGYFWNYEHPDEELDE